MFLARGLERGEKCVHLGDEHTHRVLQQRLMDRGVDVARMTNSHALVLIAPTHIGLKGDSTDVYRMFTHWKRMIEAAAREDFSTLRAAIQMNWLRADVTAPERLQAYEERLTQLAEDTRCTFLCQYDSRHQSAAFVLEAVCTHAHVIDRGELCRNVYCTSGEETLAISPEARIPELLLRGLREHERSRRQVVETQTELARLARITTLGELTASVAHEVAQPVAAMIADSSAAARWLASTPPRLDEARLSLARIVSAGRRAESVIQRIRSLVKKADSSKELLNLNEVIVDVLALTRNRLQQADIVLRTELATALPATWAHRVQIEQVLLNLLVNSLEAIDAGSTGKREICIRTSHDSRSATVSIADSGIGLGTEQVQFVMKPFYTTKPHNMGIGLSISSRIVEAHDGQLWAERNPDGLGATFHFTLPVEGSR